MEGPCPEPEAALTGPSAILEFRNHREIHFPGRAGRERTGTWVNITISVQMAATGLPTRDWDGPRAA